MARFLIRDFVKSGSLNGTDNYVNIGTMGNLGSLLASGLSISLWVKSNLRTAMTMVGTRVTSTNMYLNFKLNSQSGSNNADYVQFQFVDGSAVALNGYAQAQKVNNGEWHHLVATMNPSGSAITLYMDGVALTVTYNNQNAPSSFANFANAVFLGALDNAGVVATPYYKGLMDEVTFWNSILSESEVSSLYYNGSVSGKSPVSYHKFDEGTGTSVADSVGANTGTWNGTLTSQWSTDVRMVSRRTA
jgi:hypothetical protein